MYPKPMRLLQDILRENVAERPNKVALICEKTRLTYAQIDEMSNRLANAFVQSGIREGDRILFYLMNSAELVVSIFAALKANAIFSVIDYANTFETLHYIAADCQAAALVTHDLQAEAAARLLAEIPSLRLAVLSGEKAASADFRSLSDFGSLLSFEVIQADYPPDILPQKRIDSDLAYLIYTSGSTGISKGVMVTHRCILFTIQSGIEYLGQRESDVHTSPLPLSFSPGINQLFQTFRVGGTLILERSFAYPAMTLKRMVAEGATGLATVPTILVLLLKTDPSRYDLSRLRYITSIGAALAPSIIQQVRQKLPHALLYSTYGMAEASFSLGLEPAQIDQRPASVGKPFPGTQAWIIDEDGRRRGRSY